MSRTLRGKVAVVGVGQTTYYKHGQSPDAEAKLALQAIVNACDDAQISPTMIDGFASFSDDRNRAPRMAAALNTKELRFSDMFWGGGGGGTAGAVEHAAAAIAGGMADCVVVYRSLAQGQFGRFGRGAEVRHISGDNAHTTPYGVMSAAQSFAMKVTRFMHEHGVKQEALQAIALTCYAHAQNNPAAIMYGRPLTAEKYNDSRWIVEPFHLYDSCQENDGAAAMLLVPAERAADFPHRPCYLLGAASGGTNRSAAPVHNTPDYGSSHFGTVAGHLYRMAELAPTDIDVLQSYENFTGGVMMAIIEHGFCTPSEANEFFQMENLLAAGGRLPLNTSGGNLAECYMHGLGLAIEAVRQIRGTSCNQVDGAEVSMMIAGPMVTPVSSCIFGSASTL